MHEHLLSVRFAIAAGADASRWLEEIPERVDVELPDRIQMGLLGALIALEERDPDRALETLSTALRLAAPSGHRQMFLDERPGLGAVLDNAAARAGVRFPQREPASILGTARDAVAPFEIESIDLVEPLTERELEVLRLLPSHRTYQHIGDDLGVSINTVKYHLKSIYRKLETDGRAATVRRAVRSGLVSD
jgi:LuxR family maltose regulon positive regulatory protein